MSGLRRIRRALLSVTDKTGLVEFARALAAHDIELVSTGGTARALREAGLSVRDISDLTGFPEMLDGRVKTLHPKVHGGILHIRGNKEHVAAVREHGIEPIDMVAVNLYAFEKTANKPGVAFSEIIENIDIGGPSMVRSAAKNFEDVAIVTSVADYAPVAEELGGERRLAGARDALAAGEGGLRGDGGLRRGDCHDAGEHCGARCARRACGLRRGGDAAGHPRHPSAEDGAALRRESAPEGRAVCGWKRGRSGLGKTVAGQVSELQQPGRFGRLLATGGRV